MPRLPGPRRLQHRVLMPEPATAPASHVVTSKTPRRGSGFGLGPDRRSRMGSPVADPSTPLDRVSSTCIRRQVIRTSMTPLGYCHRYPQWDPPNTSWQHGAASVLSNAASIAGRLPAPSNSCDHLYWGPCGACLAAASSSVFDSAAAPRRRGASTRRGWPRRRW